MEQIQDIPKIYTAIAEWMSCIVVVVAYCGFAEIKKKPLFKIGTMAGGLAMLSAVHAFCGMVTNIVWVLGMVVAVSVMIFIIKLELSTSVHQAVYFGCRAFMFAELVAALNWQLFFFYFITENYNNFINQNIFCCVIYLIAFAFFYKLEVEIFPEELSKNNIEITNRQLLTTVIVTALFFTLSNLNYTGVQTPFSVGEKGAVIFNIRTLIDLAGFVILEAMFIQKLDDDRTNEMNAIKNILHTQYVQYRTSQDNIDLINRKYHDLKHQLQIIRQESNQDKKNEYIDEIEAGIRKYEAENKTGNAVLDTILTSKSSLCLKHGIQMVSIVDGTLLSHIHVMDLCTIFGNALDNAIEYEIQIPDREKRMIHITVSEKNKMVAAVVENYCEKEVITDKDSLPRTTKTDKKNHGYGIKSIKYSAEKYGGYVNISNANNWFRVEMLFPKGK